MPEQNALDAMLGTPAPDFRLPSSTGGEINLKEALANHQQILFFVREYN